MNLGLEYLARTKLVEKFFRTPCSIFLKDRDGANKVVTFHDDITMRLWHIDRCNSTSALPPMSEYQVKDIDEIKERLSECHILHYKESPIPDNCNCWRYPMPNRFYENFLLEITNSPKHKRQRDLWLWNIFKETYALNQYLTIYQQTLSEYSQFMFINNEKKQNKLQKFWSLWKKHMMLPEAELSFTNLL